jgi:hypothetical protein
MRPMIDTEILLAVDGELVPLVVIEWDENEDFFQVRYEGDVVDVDARREGETWRRVH